MDEPTKHYCKNEQSVNSGSLAALAHMSFVTFPCDLTAKEIKLVENSGHMDLVRVLKTLSSEYELCVKNPSDQLSALPDHD